MTDSDNTRLPLVLVGMLLVVVAGGTVDLILDDPERWLTLHVLFELAMIATSLAFAIYLWRGWWRTSRSLDETRRVLEERSAERDAWRRSAHAALEGLGEAIDAQFESWGLTPTEREVALLLLKGHSHKYVARLTGRSERTVRQHSVAIYGKSGLTGRAELAAFFLEDLILPGSERRVMHGTGGGEGGAVRGGESDARAAGAAGAAMRGG